MKKHVGLDAVFLILFLVFSLPEVLSQSSAMVTTEISPNPVGRGDRFGITIVVATENSDTLTVEAPNLPDNIVLLRGPYIRPVWITDASGQSQKRTEITYLYRSDATGRFEIGPYRIMNINRVYTTQALLLEVGVYRNRELVIPLDLQWEIRPETVFVGQNVLCILKSLEERDIRMYDEPSVTPPAEGFFQPAEGVGDIRRYTRGGVSLYELPLGSFIFTPSSSGRITIPAAALTWEKGRAVSDQVNVVVQALPEAVQASGAVGSFRFFSEIEKRDIVVGERILLTLWVEGTGNLNFLQFPSIENPGFSLVEEDERNNFVATADGYRGIREYRYTLLAEEAGNKTIRVNSFSAIQPLTERVYTLPGASYRMGIADPGVIGDDDSEAEEFPFELEGSTELQQVNLSRRFLSWSEYLWLLPGPVLFFLFLLLKRRKFFLPVVLLLFLSFAAGEMTKDTFGGQLDKATEAYNSGKYVEAEYLFEKLAEELPEYPDLRYNAALSAYRQEKTGEAVWYTRTALVQQPVNNEYRAFLDALAEQNEISTTVDLPFPFHPDFFLFIITLGVNISGFLGIFLLFYRRNAYFIGAALLLVVSFIAGIGMAVSIISERNDTAVAVSGDEGMIEVKKIPRSDSENAFLLKEGETLHIRGKSEDYLFLTTALGQKGWVAEDYVKMIPGIIELTELESKREK